MHGILVEYMKANDCQPLIEGCASTCSSCARPLCLRQQVINLALGFVDEMRCLQCLGDENKKKPDSVLDDLMVYIHSRECFKSQWVKYLDESHCPFPKECYPSVCFKEIEI